MSDTTVNFTWNVTDVQESALLLNLEFEDPIRLHNGDYQLQVVVTGDQFQSSTGQFTPIGFSLIQTLPPQIPACQTATLQASTTSLSSSMNTLVVSNIAFSFSMSTSLSILWGLINCLQIAVYMPLLNVEFPPNVGLMLNKLTDVATFNILPMDLLNSYFFNFTETPPYSDRALRINFKSLNFFENLGSLYIYFFLLPL